VAARKALLEVGQVRPALKRRMREKAARERLAALVADPGSVATLDDHDLLYASPQMLGAFGFLLDRPIEPVDWEPPVPDDAPCRLRALTEHWAASGGDILYYNLTPPDMQDLGLYTARVIVPDAQPIYFGRQERRLGGRRLFSLPKELGLTGAASAPEGLNPDPHPLA
jgi:ribosomal protein S12 methylthiotransferase accessory factor